MCLFIYLSIFYRKTELRNNVILGKMETTIFYFIMFLTRHFPKMEGGSYETFRSFQGRKLKIGTDNLWLTKKFSNLLSISAFEKP